MLLATATGLGFRFQPNFEETTRNGRKIARLSADDAVISIQPAGSGRTVCATAAGYLLAFPTEDIAELSGAGRGVILMRLEQDDRLVGAVTSEPGAGVTVLNTDGKERKIPLREIPLGKRAGKGRRVVKRSTLAGLRQNGARNGAPGLS